MGKGDKKTKRGKLFMGSYGKKRPRNKGIVKSVAAVKVVKDVVTKPVKEKKEKHVAEVKAPKEKAPVKEVKAVKEKKEEKPVAEVKAAAKPKKEKKAE